MVLELIFDEIYSGTQKLVQRICIDKWYKKFIGHVLQKIC